MPSEQPKAKAAKRRMVWSVINIACDASVKFDENEKYILVMLEPNDFARTMIAVRRMRSHAAKHWITSLTSVTEDASHA
jgi:hypothetical protein